MQELIFNHQLTHQRNVIDTIGRARRKWKRLYHWFPVEQNRLYSEMDRVYRETKEKMDTEMFRDYAHEKRLNKRFVEDGVCESMVNDDICKLKLFYPPTENNMHLPLMNFRERCGDPRFCQKN